MANLKLGAFAEQLRGRSGNSVFVRTLEGISVRDYTIPKDPRSPLQLAARSRMAEASRLWNTLNPVQARAWRDYSLTLGQREPGTGRILAPRAQNVFVGLPCKLLHANPQASVPLAPPPFAFFGDAICVDFGTESGQVVFTASGANHLDVVTELLVQPLRNGASQPQLKAYRTQAFVSFTIESLSASFAVSPGWYAAAYRFIKVQTGQESQLAALEPVLV